MATCNFSVKNVKVLSFTELTAIEKQNVLGSGLYHTVNAALACAGAATSVFVLQGVFGTDIIGRFEQLVGIIGGTVIGYVGGCIVFGMSGIVALGFVASFLLGALSGGVICVMTAYRKEILSAIHYLWTAAMKTLQGFATVVVEAVQIASAKTVKVMANAYNTICNTLDRVRQSFGKMSKEQKAEVLKHVQTAVDKVDAKIGQSLHEHEEEIDKILAPFDKQGVVKDYKEKVRSIQENNSAAIKKEMESLKSDETCF